MEIEEKLAHYVSDTKFDDLPEKPIEVARNMVLANLGAIIAGSTEEGCEAQVNLVKEWGGNEEATILIYGGKVPAHNAAYANSVMARILDFDDGMEPGVHLGTSAVPTALAVAELAGGASGKEILTAITVGTEIASRINFSSAYNGFAGSGVCVPFGTAAIAGRILHLNVEQMLNALALAFDHAGGSMQAYVDGSLAWGSLQGFISHGGIICAQLAQRGITGPRNFFEGVFGYFHLFGKENHDPQTVVDKLGERFDMTRDMFKRYPSCGSTIASTDAIIYLIEEKDLTPEDVTSVDITVPPYTYDLVGHQFEIGDNPSVNAKFSIQYCVANALLRKDSRLEHFEESAIREPKIMELVKKIHVSGDPALERRGHLATDMEVRTKGGAVYHKSVDIPHGFPGNPLTKEEHTKRFLQCVSYAHKPLPKENVDKIVSLVGQLEEVRDIRSLIPLLLA